MKWSLPKQEINTGYLSPRNGPEYPAEWARKRVPVVLVTPLVSTVINRLPGLNWMHQSTAIKYHIISRLHDVLLDPFSPQSFTFSRKKDKGLMKGCNE